MKRTMFRTPVLLVVAGLLGLAGGCASQPQNGAARTEAIDRILAEPAADGAVERCLPVRAYRTVEVLDERHLLFEGGGDRLWLNRLRTPCAGLDPRDTLVFDLHATRVCELDSVTAMTRIFWMWQRVSATCTLGSFQPVTETQAELIREAARSR